MAATSPTPSQFSSAALLLLLAHASSPAAAATAAAATAAAARAAPALPSSSRLRTEYLEAPVCIDEPRPRFSWAPLAGRRGTAVASYRVVVTALTDGSVAWDSGLVPSNATTNIAYAGVPLASDADYSWTVSWTDDEGAASSPVSAAFSTALFSPADWRSAQWVGGDFIRAEFNVSGSFSGPRVRRARLFLSSPGWYKAFINSAVVDDHELGGFTTFEERILYDAVDVTSLVVPGCNTLGLLIGGGWWARTSGLVNRPHDPSTRVVLSVTDDAGAITYFASTLGGGGIAPGTLPLAFTSSQSPVTSADVYGGESYDARLEQPGWAACGFVPPAGAAAWVPAPAVALDPLAPNNFTGGPFISANTVQIRVDEDFPLVAVTQLPSGDLVADFGQHVTKNRSHAARFLLLTLNPDQSRPAHRNLAGFPSIAVICPGGPQTITLRLAESVDADGDIIDAYGGTIAFTCAGTGAVEHHTPVFHYSGYRYARVTNWPGTLSPGPGLVSHFVHADVAPTGAFGSSSTLLNKVQHATRFAALSNLMSTPTDCPTREKHGYLGDGGLAAETEVLNFDMAAFYTRWMRDVRDDQSLRAAQGGGNIPPGGACPGCVPGCVPDVVPFYTWGSCHGDPGSTFGYTHIVDLVHQYHADDLIVQRNFDGVAQMTGVYEALLNNASSPNPGALSYVLYGDWNTIEQDDDRTHGADMGTFHFTRDADILTRWAAEVTHNETAEARYAALAAAARAAYRSNFFDAKQVAFTDPTYYGTRFPAISQIIALALGGVTASDAEAAAVFANFLALLAAGDGVGIANASVWGIIGQKHAWPVFSAFGREDFALSLLLSTSMPSPGYWIQEFTPDGVHIGATTLFEWWRSNATIADGWSRNHIMYGGFGSWLFTAVAGLSRAPGSRGWQRLMLRPAAFAHPAVTSASASVATAVGIASIAWQQALPTPAACALGVQGGPQLQLQCVSKTVAAPTFSGVRFASYGLPTGSCAAGFARNASCDDSNTTAHVSKACVGKASCGVDSNGFGDPDPCPGYLKQLAIELDGPCDAAVVLRVSVSVPVGAAATTVLPLGPGRSAASVSVSEASTGAFVWVAGAFVPGTAGVVGAAAGPPGTAPVGQAAVVLSLQSGTYLFDILA